MKTLVVPLIGCTLLALSACSTATSEPSGSGGTTAGETSAPTESAPADPLASVTDVTSRYSDCEAIGTVLGSAIDGLIPDEASTFESDMVQCAWLSTDEGAGDLETVSVAIDPNQGADDVATPDVLTVIGAEQIPDAVIESHGGIAYFTSGTGDLRIAVTTVDIPGMSVSITHGVLGSDPSLVGPAAVDVIKQLLTVS